MVMFFLERQSLLADCHLILKMQNKSCLYNEAPSRTIHIKYTTAHHYNTDLSQFNQNLYTLCLNVGYLTIILTIINTKLRAAERLTMAKTLPSELNMKQNPAPAIDVRTRFKKKMKNFPQVRRRSEIYETIIMR